MSKYRNNQISSRLFTTFSIAREFVSLAAFCYSSDFLVQRSGDKWRVSWQTLDENSDDENLKILAVDELRDMKEMLEIREEQEYEHMASFYEDEYEKLEEEAELEQGLWEQWFWEEVQRDESSAIDEAVEAEERYYRDTVAGERFIKW